MEHYSSEVRITDPEVTIRIVGVDPEYGLAHLELTSSGGKIMVHTRITLPLNVLETCAELVSRAVAKVSASNQTETKLYYPSELQND